MGVHAKLGLFSTGTLSAPPRRGLGTQSPSAKAPLAARRPGARRGERPAAGPSAALGRAAAIAASVCSAFNFPFLVLFPSSAPPPSVRQALSSVGSHLRVNIISDGHNRLE